MLKKGDWITQYHKGYWKIIDIKPKYAEEDYLFENGKFQKKGDWLGSWILMKKGFTQTMSFRIESDICDSAWCKKVSQEEYLKIEQYFKAHPKEFEKFENAIYVDHPAVSILWLQLTADEIEKVLAIIMELPEKFTIEHILGCFKEQELQRIISNPPANYMLLFWHTLWEIDAEFNPLFRKPELYHIENGKRIRVE